MNVNSGEPDAFLWACMQNMHKCMCAHERAHTHTHTNTEREREKFYTQTQIYTHTYTDSKTKIYTYSGLHRQAHKLHTHTPGLNTHSGQTCRGVKATLDAVPATCFFTVVLPPHV